MLIIISIAPNIVTKPIRLNMPLLYVLTTFVSLKLNEVMSKKRKEDAIKNAVVTERVVSRDENKEEKSLVPTDKEDDDTLDTMNDMSKTMTWMMPIMSVSISLIAPLGLALYWLVGNVFMIIERLITNKIINDNDK